VLFAAFLALTFVVELRIVRSFMSSPQDSRFKSIAVTLSGGGHRATLFGLGALMYLVDARANTNVSSIASVSGGSQIERFRTLIT
jgi:hypothetical protein